jgi:DNA-binding CsgD family transcriptional regulator
MEVILTKRELEILQLIAKEMTTENIATYLKITTSTVETHRKNLLRKAGVKSSVGLMNEAYKNRWLG